jgi:hypothetical protein
LISWLLEVRSVEWRRFKRKKLNSKVVAGFKEGREFVGKNSKSRKTMKSVKSAIPKRRLE